MAKVAANLGISQLCSGATPASQGLHSASAHGNILAATSPRIVCGGARNRSASREKALAQRSKSTMRPSSSVEAFATRCGGRSASCGRPTRSGGRVPVTEHGTLNVEIAKNKFLDSESNTSTTDGDSMAPSSLASQEPSALEDKWDEEFAVVQLTEERPIRSRPSATKMVHAEVAGAMREIFVQHLRQKRGSALRAWRMDIDRRSSGKVSFVDFVRECSKIGAPVQTKHLSTALSPQRQPVEFAALCPEEASSLQNFAELLWASCGCDIAKVWEYMDCNHQNWLSLQEFEEITAEIGYLGDTKLLFRALDSSGLGRIRRADLEYVQKIVHVGRSASQQGGRPIADFSGWIKREQGGLEAFMHVINLGSDSYRSEMPVSEFVSMLVALGFDGESATVAKLLARASGSAHGGTIISSEAIDDVLSGRTKAAQETTNHRAQSALASARAKAKVQLEARPNWVDSFDVSGMNREKCKGDRAYFGTPEKQHQVVWHGLHPSTERPEVDAVDAGGAVAATLPAYSQAEVHSRARKIGCNDAKSNIKKLLALTPRA